jgi:predicted deacylase
LGSLLPYVCILILANVAGVQAGCTSGLLAEGTVWENPYYVIDSGVAGPTLLITAGLHGNEPAGYWAAEQIRHWPIERGRLIVVPSVNRPGLQQKTRWLPGEPPERRNANRNFPKSGGPEEVSSLPVQALWEFMKEQGPDWVIDLHEGFDFRVANPKSDGSMVIYFKTPEMEALAARICREVNAAIEDPNRRIVGSVRGGPIDGGLVRAAVERLGAKGFCLETTYQKQPLSTRTRQHRIMVHCLMRELGMASDSVHVLADGRDSRRTGVAVYDADGTGGQGVENLERIFASHPGYVLCHLGPAEIRAGVLDQFHVVIFPGGSGSKEAAALTKEGCRMVRRFVESGGGYVGICAGAFLATAKYDWSLGLVNARTFTGRQYVPGEGEKSMWFHGTGTVQMELTAPGREILGDVPGIVELRYANGPIFSPAGREDLPEYVPLAFFRTEIAKYEPQKGTMVDTPAIIASAFGRGRVVAISPHPEASAQLESLVRRAVAWAAGKPGRQGGPSQ